MCKTHGPLPPELIHQALDTFKDKCLLLHMILDSFESHYLIKKDWYQEVKEGGGISWEDQSFPQR